MEGGERAQSHRSGSEFFICFTARPSSSSASCSGAMRVPSSKSLMSPGRGRDPAAPSLSASLSRRLRSSGSVKGGQSPMFPAGVSAAPGGGRRKGCAFEAAEPSSPKVTCIGQVRVKSKKKRKSQSKGQAVGRSRSQRSGGGEASFRRTSEQEKRVEGENRNQRWVHQLPLSICEALRTLGSELNCFGPCGGGRSPCSSSRTGEEKGVGGNRSMSGTSSCGTVFTRWLMAIQEEGEERNKGEVVGLVVEEGNRGEVGFLVREREMREKGYLEMGEVGNVEKAEKKEEVAAVVVEEEGQVSACIPPRNALLLMRCRSDPVRVAALADRFWGSPAAKAPCVEAAEDEDDRLEEEVGVGEDLEEEADQLVSSETEEVENEETTVAESLDGVVSAAALEENHEAEEEVKGHEEEDRQERRPDEEEEEEEEGISKGVPSADSPKLQRNPSKGEEEPEEIPSEAAGEREMKDETHFLEREEEREGGGAKGRRSGSCPSSDKGEDERRSNSCPCSKAKEGGRRRSCPSKQKERRRHSFSLAREARRHSFSTEREARRASFSADREGRRRWSFSLEKEELILEKKATTPSAIAAMEQNREVVPIGAEVMEVVEVEKSVTAEESQVTAAAAEGRGGKEEEAEDGEGGEEKRGGIPDCLLLMMYEPKLSMEVSKETWVCSTDFLRWLPDQPRHGHRPHHPSSKSGGGGPMAGRAGGLDEGGDDSCSDNKGSAAAAAVPDVQPPPPPPLPPPLPPSSAAKPKLVGSAVAPQPEAPPYGQFVLTRCKSEPVRSSARLAPDACFWKDRHRPIGVAGIGF